jgi:hypothetical protein
MEYSFVNSLKDGEKGVQVVKEQLNQLYPGTTEIDDRDMQKNGVDLHVPGLGWVEVKCDSHTTGNVFLELEVDGKPGWVDCCGATFVAFYYPGLSAVYLIQRSELQRWLRHHYTEILEKHKDWVKRIRSRRGKSTWETIGLAIPWEVLKQDITVVEWSTHGQELEGC